MTTGEQGPEPEKAAARLAPEKPAPDKAVAAKRAAAEPAAPTRAPPTPAPRDALAADPPPRGVFDRLKDHKVLQWAVAYLGSAAAIAQAYELVANAFHWPDVVARALIVALVIGFPVALTIAWYHGHRALRRVSIGEITIVSLLLLVGASVFTVVLRRDDAGAFAAAAAAGSSGAPAAPPAAGAGPGSAAASPGAAPSELPELPNKVAVLPCENQSPDPEDAYFASGLHQDIIWQLDKLRNLTTIPRLTVMRYANTALPISAIATELSVRALLDCTVRYADNRVRITAELIDSTGLRTLWQGDYEPSLADIKDVFAVQADIAMNIANALSVVFTPGEQALLTKPPTVSTEAYVLFLRAYEEPDYAMTVELFEQSVAADGNFAAPRAALAFLWASELTNTNYAAAIAADARDAHTAKLRAYAERALELDPTIPFARSALTMAAMLNWRWSEAYEHVVRARSVTPNDVTQYDVFLLSYLSRYDEAMNVVQRGEQLYPNDPNNHLWRGWALGLARRFDEAAAAFATAVSETPGDQSLLTRDWLARMEIARGNAAAALEQLRISEDISGTTRQALFLPSWAYAYGRLGRAEDARRLFAEMQEREAAGTQFGAGGWAMANFAIGDRGRAAEWLERAADKAEAHELDEGFFNLMALRANVTNDDVLEEPRIAAALARVQGD